MSKEIDERIVSMKFDNANFEKNVSTTIGTLDKLKQMLNLKGSSKGLEEVNKAASNIDLNQISSSVETVGFKFSAMEVMAITALTNITNSAVNTGKKILSAFTLDPITSGFQEYETQINAVQTILANTQSKGSTLDDVNKALDELNKYADMTIYNFTEMTRNIGTFTAAGVDLERSVTSIKGIANLAAISGSTSQQASTAMYQLSQALASGRVALQDWNSVVNAGMGGELFQEALKRTATNMGTNVDELIKKYGSFRESLTKGEWLTSEVLTETLTQLSGAYTEADLIAQGYSKDQAKTIYDLSVTAVDAATKVKTFTQLWDTLTEAAQSGWTQTWEIIIGDFNEAKELLTGISDFISDIINKASDRRNALLEGALGSKWDQLAKRITAAGIPMDKFKEKLKETAKENGIAIDKIIKKEGSLENAFKRGKLSGNLIIQTLKKMAGMSSTASKATGDMTDKLEYFQKVVDKVWNGDYKNGKERVKALTKAGYDYNQVQKLVNKTINGQKLKLEDLTDVQLKSVGYTDKQIKKIRALAKEAEKAGTPLNELIESLNKPSGRELLIDTAKNVFQPIIKIISSIREAWENAFPPMSSNTLYNIIDGLNTFSTYLVISEETANNLTRTLKGVFAILDLVSMVVGGGFRISFTIATKVIGKTLEVLGFANANILSLTASVGDMIVAFRDWIEEHSVLNEIIDFTVPLLINLVKSLYDFIVLMYNLPEVQNGLKTISNWFLKIGEFFSKYTKPMSDFIKELKTIENLTLDKVVKSFNNMISKMFEGTWFKGLFDKIPRDMISGLVNGLKEGTPKVMDVISHMAIGLLDLVKKILGIHSPSREMYEIGKNTIDGLVNSLSDGTSRVMEVVKNIFNGIIDFLKNLNWGSIAAGGFGIGLLYVIKNIADAISAIGAPFEGLGELLSGAGKVLDKAAKPIAKTIKSFSKVVSSYALKIKAKALLDIAKAVAILAGSVYLLAQLDSAKLWESIGALAALSGVLVLLSYAMTIMGSAKVAGIGKVSLSIIAMSIALYIMSSAIKKLASLDPAMAGYVIIGFAVIVGSLIKIMSMYGKMASGENSRNIDKAGIVIYKIAKSLLLMTLVFKLASMLSIGDMIKGGLVVLEFIGIIALLTMISQMGGKTVDKLGSTLIKMAFAMLILVGVVKGLSSMNPEDLKKGIRTMWEFVGMIAVLTLITKLSSKSHSVGRTLFAISLSMLMMVGVIKLISGINASDLIKGSFVILGFVFMIKLLVSIVSKSGEHAKVTGTLLAMSISISIMAGICILLGFIDLKSLAKGIFAVGMLSLFMAGLIQATRGAEDIKGTIMAMAITIAVMATAVAILSFIDPVKLASGVLALVSVMGTLAIIIKQASGLQGTMGPIITMTVMLSLLVGSLWFLTTLPTDKLLTSVASISSVLLSLSIAMFIVSKSGNTGIKALASIAIMVLVLGSIGYILYKLGELNPGQTLEIAKSISLVLLALSGTMAVLTLIGSAGPGAFIGIAALITFMTSIAALFAGIGALAEYYPQLEEFLDRGIDLMIKVGKGLGESLGSIIDGFIMSSTSGLPDLGLRLSEFMTALTPFITGVKQIDPKTSESVKTLVEAITYLVGANLLDKVASWISGESSLTEFAKQLIPFGIYLSLYSNIIKNVDSKAIEASANAGKILAEFADNIPNSGGLLASITGDNSITDFAKELLPFGIVISEYSKVVKGIDEKSIEASANAGRILTEFADTIPNSGGLLASITGDNSISEFAKELLPFGSYISLFSSLVKNVDEKAVEASANAGSILAKFAEAIPNSGGLLASITGDNSISEFAKEMLSYGENIGKYSAYVSNVDMSSVQSSANAGIILTDFVKNISKSKVSGNNGLNKLTDELIPFAHNISLYSSIVKWVSLDSINNSVIATKKLSDMIKDMGGINPIGVDSFVYSLNKLSEANVSGFINVFNGSKDKLENVGAGMVTSMLNGVRSQQASTESTINGIFNTLSNSANSKSKSLKKVGYNLISGFISGMDSKKSDFIKKADELINSFMFSFSSQFLRIKKVMSSLMTFAELTVRGYNKNFYNAGSHVVDGLASGISDNAYKVESKARAMANAAAEAVRKTLEIHSPSRTFYKIGDFASAGFINALNDNVKNSYNSGYEIAQSAKSGLSKAISRIDELVASDIEDRPTIRPILDLSDVKMGAKAIDNLISSGTSVGLLTNIGAVAGSRNIQNGNLDVVSAINKLRKDIGKMNNVTYSINGITYDDGSNVSNAVKSIIRAARIERRV